MDANRGGFGGFVRSGSVDEGATDAIAQIGALGPDRFQIHTHGRKNRDVQNRENILRQTL
jgi:hypothetical protein